MKSKLVRGSSNSIKNNSELLQLVKEKFSMYSWIFPEPVEIQYGEDNFVTDLDTLYDIESSKFNVSIFDLTINPEVEITFQCDEEYFAQIYTNMKGQIRCICLDID